MAALNLKSMSFDGGDIVHISEDRPIMGEEDPEPNTVNMLLDVSFATNVRYLDEQVSEKYDEKQNTAFNICIFRKCI